MKSASCRHLAVGICRLAILISQLLICLTSAQAARPVQSIAPEAERLTQQAVDAGLEGNLQRRRDLLERAISIAPNYEPARWEAGQILVDGKWYPLDEAQALAAADPQFDRYRNARFAARDNPIGHLQLARWCRKNQLTDEARFHWLRVLSTNPQNTEALQALDSTWHGGRLVSSDVARDLQQQERTQRRANRKWKVRIARWERALAEGPATAKAALKELRSTVDASAIPEFENLASGQKRVKPTVARHRHDLSLAFIDSLDEMPNYSATESLVRYAVLAPDESLRAAATDALVDRPQHESVPLLLSGLASTIESHFNLSMGSPGYVSYSHEFFTEGPTADQVYERARGVHFNVHAPPVPDAWRNNVRAARIANATRQSRIANATRRLFARAQQKLRQFQIEARRVERQVATENSRRLTINERITTVLRQVVGEDLGDDPVAWWDHWRDYNEYERLPYRPTDYDRQSSYERYTCYVPPPRPSSCFVAGTPVWTKTSLAPIESLSAGDLVLSQNTATGEFNFRPVLAATKRAPSPTLRIVAGGEEIQTTLGHPFWLPNIGWRMAKELATGDRLLAIDNPVQIEEISVADDEFAFNLVVDGPGNYFVGRDGLMVHDNSPRRPELVRLAER